MQRRRAHVSSSTAQSGLADALAALRAAIGVPAEFPEAVRLEAERAAAAPDPDPQRTDLRALAFCTIDPAGSKDLDQALFIERSASGFTLRYAIADVASFVTPGGALDVESRERGQTLYAPDARVPLYPAVLSEGVASLLPDADRRALVWTFTLDADGRVTGTTLERALIRSVRQWSYPEAQAAIDDGSAPDSLALLAEVGPARIVLEGERGGASLDLPEEEIVRTADGYGIERRVLLPVEGWNAQVSLLTGMAAAELMLRGGIGILRTMPPADADTLEAFRAQTVALGLPWTTDLGYGAYLRSLPADSPVALAVRQAAAGLFRGAGYTTFTQRPDQDPVQAAIGAPYAHVTAPLRRLVDRFGLEICLAISTGAEVPAWARDALPGLPAVMAASSTIAGRLESGAVDRVEAALIGSKIGAELDAVVLSSAKGRARVQLIEPVVTASLPTTDARPGTTIRVRVVSADIGSGTVNLEAA